MSEETKKEKILKIRKPVPVPFVLVLMGLFVLYLLIHGIVLLAKKPVQVYQVGASSADSMMKEYTGLILRNEKIVTAEKDEYVNYFVLSGDWVSDRKLICSVSDDGNVQAKLLSLFSGRAMLTESERIKIQSAIRSVALNYDGIRFETAIRGKGEISAAVLDILMSEIDDPDAKLKGLDYTPFYATESGFVIQWVDGLEGLSVNALTAADFTPLAHVKTPMKNGSKVSAGAPIYKLAPDNEFRLVFLMTDSDRAMLASRKTLSVETSGGLSLTGTFSTAILADGKTAGMLDFSRYGANFLSERYETFRILDKSAEGFKVPESALVSKSFFVIPKEYLTPGGGGNELGVFAEVQGRYTFVPVMAFQKAEEDEESLVTEEGMAFVMSADLTAGQRIAVVGNSDKTTTLGRMTNVEGCYQINNGYPVFKPVLRLQNSLDTSYVMISSRLKGTIRPYDRIAENASEISEKDVVFR